MMREGSLVLYKGHPARVARLGEKLDIELDGGETQKVRPKDVILLHAGPIKVLGEALRPQQGEVETAWEMLAGAGATLAELAELAYGAFTPATAWSAWQIVANGLYFRGTPEAITACTAEEVAHTREARAADFAEKQAWAVFLGHMRTGCYEPYDTRFLREVEMFALGRMTRCRVLRELGKEETPEVAHALLLDLGYWTTAMNPYPTRLEVSTAQPDVPLPPLPDEPRRDLTHLPAIAIDDASTDTPDDALSFEPAAAGGGRIWVHIADPAALAPPDSPLDLEARGRGSSLYLPEGAINMLPPAATPLLGLGLQDVSPALSFGLDLTPDGRIMGLEVVASQVRVARLTYDEAAERMTEEPLASLYRLAQAYLARRIENGAISIDLPEVDVRVVDGQVALVPVPTLPSRVLVENAMIMTGEAVAAYAIECGIPMPFSTQEPPDDRGQGPGVGGQGPGAGDEAEGSAVDGQPSAVGGPSSFVSLSAMFALRKTFKRSQYRSAPGPHSGLGLTAYTQATSPMRRYLDLVAHQQLRRHLRGEPLLTEAEILERVGATEAVIGSLRQAEHLSNQHWTLVYLLQHEGWQGAGILVDRRDRNSIVLIPALGWEAHMPVPNGIPVDSTVQLRATHVDLPRLDVRFRIIRDG
jgi:exoribonuclease-2